MTWATSLQRKAVMFSSSRVVAEEVPTASGVAVAIVVSREDAVMVVVGFTV